MNTFLLRCAVFTAALLLSLCANAQNQQLSPTPFKLCNLIMVKTEDGYEQAWKKLKLSFADAEFEIRSSDEEIHTLTGVGMYSKSNPITITATIKDEGIVYQGNFGGPSIELYGVRSSGVNQIEYRGMSKSPFMQAFSKMDALAKSYGGDVFYFFK